MKKAFFIFLLFSCLSAGAQLTISGTIRDEAGQAIAFANVFLEGSYDGCISDSAGSFRFQTILQGERWLQASFIGYRKYAFPIDLEGRDTSVSIILEPESNELQEVSITAGSFSASDRQKRAILSSFDIATTASAMGDIYGAYATMPGVQKVGEDGMLFVRGGEHYETRTYMDGMLVPSPYFSKLPDIPTRGRYSPLLFSETTFSTGGYSAEFGQALSSVVDLHTNGMESEDKASISLMSVGGSASMGKRWGHSSLALTGMYTHTGLNNKIFRQNIDWISGPVLADGTLMFRKQVKDKGMLKVFCSYNFNEMEMNYDNFAEGSMEYLAMSNHNLHTTGTYTGELSEHWDIRTGISWGQDLENMEYRVDPIRTQKTAFQAKAVLSRNLFSSTRIHLGSSVTRMDWGKEIHMEETYLLSTNNLQPVLFSEMETRIAGKLALRAGLRGEYSSLMKGSYLSPRLSAALKTGDQSQLSLAWGLFSQLPQSQILAMAPQLEPERAAHWILNYQYRKNRRTFRAETYLKRYSDLVKYLSPHSPDATTYSNVGSGYAVGFDVFWRDRASVRGLDYWISYSFLDTERDYQNFPHAASPDFASAHNLSVVAKYFLERLRTFTGVTYSFASPRPYHDKNSNTFMDGRTNCYHDLSIGLTHVTRLLGQQLVIHLGVNGILAKNNIYGYDFASIPDPEGYYPSRPVGPSTGTMAVLVFLISF